MEASIMDSKRIHKTKLGISSFFLVTIFLTTSVLSTPGVERNEKIVDSSIPFSSKTILWDTHHVPNPSPRTHPDSINTIFRSIVEDLNFELFVSDSGLLNLDLNDFGGLIIASDFDLGHPVDDPYTAEEVSIIRDFVNNGGGLLIMGEDHERNPENINPVAQIFGTTTGINGINPQSLIITNLVEHPIFYGVDTVFFLNAGRLESVSPSVPVAWEDAGQLVVAVAEFGKGRVVITGDGDGFDDPPQVFGIERNMLFTENIIRWIMQLGCSTFDDLEETISEANINSRGVLRSLIAKSNNARMQFDMGNIRTAGNILCALLQEVEAQEGRHIDPGSAQEILKCVRSVAENLGIPLPCVSKKKHAVTVASFPKSANLIQNQPNPFHQSTIISYSILEETTVSLKVYDISGKLIRTLLEGKQQAKTHSIHWDGIDNFGQEIQNGIYFVKLIAGDSIQTRKLTRLK
jgi:hypothetical protein